MKKKYPDEPVEVTDKNFDKVVKKYPLVIIDSFAGWCPPCKILSPIIESLAKKLTGKVVFGKLDVDKNKETALKYGIMSVPTLLVFKKGKLIDRIVGAMPEPVLESRIKQYF